MVLSENDLELLSALGALGQVLTAIIAVVVALTTLNAASAFNRAQALKFRVEHINEFNVQILELAKWDRTAAEAVGQKVLPDSDIVHDYMNFMRINALHLDWLVAKNGIKSRSDIGAAMTVTAIALRRYGEAYVEAILARGYESAFAADIRAIIANQGGYPAAARPPAP